MLLCGADLHRLLAVPPHAHNTIMADNVCSVIVSSAMLWGNDIQTRVFCGIAAAAVGHQGAEHVLHVRMAASHTMQTVCSHIMWNNLRALPPNGCGPICRSATQVRTRTSMHGAQRATRFFGHAYYNTARGRVDLWHQHRGLQGAMPPNAVRSWSLHCWHQSGSELLQVWRVLFIGQPPTSQHSMPHQTHRNVQTDIRWRDGSSINNHRRSVSGAHSRCVLKVENVV